MKLTRGLTVVVLASGLASGLAVGASNDEHGIFGVQDAQTGRLEWMGAPGSEVATNPTTVEQAQAQVRQWEQDQERDKPQLWSASQYERLGPFG